MAAPLRTAYLLFAGPYSRTGVDSALVELTPEDVCAMLAGLALAEELSGRQDAPDEWVYYRPILIRYPLQESSTDRPWRWMGVAADPCVSTLFGPSRSTSRGTSLHVMNGWVFLSGYHDGDLYGHGAVSWAEVMLLRLATAQSADVPGVFEAFTAGDPVAALRVLEHGLVLSRGLESSRDVRALLAPTDIEPLLACPQQAVRERAIALLGALRQG